MKTTQTFEAKIINSLGQPVSKEIRITLYDKVKGTTYTVIEEKNNLFKCTDLKPGLYKVNVHIPGQEVITETLQIKRGEQYERTYFSSSLTKATSETKRNPIQIDKIKSISAKNYKALIKRGFCYAENLVWISKSKLSAADKAKALGVSEKEAIIIFNEVEKILPADLIESIQQLVEKPVSFGEISSEQIKNISGKTLQEIIKKKSILRAADTRERVGDDAPGEVVETSADHRPLMSPVKSQGSRGTCTSFAATSLREYFENISKGHGNLVNLSEQFNYWISRRDSNIGGDGWSTRAAANNYVEEGGCKEIEWPYIGSFTYKNISHKPATDQSIINANFYKIYEIEELPGKDVQAMKECINSGKVAAISTPVYWPYWDGLTGVISVPPDGTPSDGWHGVCIVGWYSDTDAPGGGYFIFKNSWGQYYARNNPLGEEYAGYNLMPFEYYEKLTSNPVTYNDLLGQGDLQWMAEYYSNSNLEGIPALKRLLHPYEHTLLSAVPYGIGTSGNFSASFTRIDRFEGGIKVFNLVVEGGVRLWIDDRLLINDWRQEAERSLSASHYITPGDHVIRIEYFRNSGPVKLEYDSNWEYWPVQLYASDDLSGPEHKRFVSTKPDMEWRHVPPFGLDTWDFSGRYRNRVHFYEDLTLRFCVKATGGFRIVLDNNIIMDAWNVEAGTNISEPVEITEGDHLIFLEFHNTSGGERAAFSLDWFEDVWHTEFYNNQDISDVPVLKRTDANLNFNWGIDSPDPVVDANNFSARFTRAIYLTGGYYKFTASSDEAMRVTVDGQKILDSWHISTTSSLKDEIFLTDGVHDFCVEYFERVGNAKCYLSWYLINWTAEYFDNTEFSGSPIVRNDNNIDFNWVVTGIDIPEFPTDQFSVRWKKTMQLEPGKYRCLLRGNGGLRLYVDDYEIINRWGEQYVEMPSIGEFETIGGDVRLRVEYADLLGNPSCSFDMIQTGWLGEYYANRNCEGAPAFYRFDPEINFDWGSTPPSPKLNRDEFSVRWTRLLDLPYGRYRIYTKCNDGIRLYIDGKLVLERWEDHTSPLLNYINIDFVGRTHSLMVEYYDNAQMSTCRVWVDRFL